MEAFSIFAEQNPTAASALIVALMSSAALYLLAKSKEFILSVVDSTLDVVFSALFSEFTVSGATASRMVAEWVQKNLDRAIWTNRRYQVKLSKFEADLDSKSAPTLSDGYFGVFKIPNKSWFFFIRVNGGKDNPGSDDKNQCVSIFSPFISPSFLRDAWDDIVGLDHRVNDDNNRTYVSYLFDCEWMQYRVRRRSLDSVFLPDDIKENVMGTIRSFFESEPWYLEKGIPHRMGIMLEGVPGSGKTSLVRAIASELDFPLCIVSLDELDASSLNAISTDTLEGPLFILFEDLSATSFSKNNQEEDSDDSGPTKMTLSEFLNAIDGVLSPENVVYFFTANNINKIDSALLRPGRIDHTFKFENATKKQADDLFTHFFGDIPDIKKRFVDSYPDKSVSVATIQSQAFLCRNNPEGMVDWAASLKADPPKKVKPHVNDGGGSLPGNKPKSFGKRKITPAL